MLRAAATLMAAVLLVLWGFLVRYLYEQTGFQPAPALVMLPLLFFGLILWAGVAAIRDEPIVLVLAGGLSLVPTGFIFLFLPGFVRWIGILDIGLIVVGWFLLRWGPDFSEVVSDQGGAGP